MPVEETMVAIARTSTPPQSAPSITRSQCRRGRRGRRARPHRCRACRQRPRQSAPGVGVEMVGSRTPGDGPARTARSRRWRCRARRSCPCVPVRVSDAEMVKGAVAGRRGHVGGVSRHRRVVIWRCAATLPHCALLNSSPPRRRRRQHAVAAGLEPPHSSIMRRKRSGCSAARS